MTLETYDLKNESSNITRIGSTYYLKNPSNYAVESIDFQFYSYDLNVSQSIKDYYKITIEPFIYKRDTATNKIYTISNLIPRFVSPLSPDGYAAGHEITKMEFCPHIDSNFGDINMTLSNYLNMIITDFKDRYLNHYVVIYDGGIYYKSAESSASFVPKDINGYSFFLTLPTLSDRLEFFGCLLPLTDVGDANSHYIMNWKIRIENINLETIIYGLNISEQFIRSTTYTNTVGFNDMILLDIIRPTPSFNRFVLSKPDYSIKCPSISSLNNVIFTKDENEIVIPVNIRINKFLDSITIHVCTDFDRNEIIASTDDRLKNMSIALKWNYVKQ